MQLPPRQCAMCNVVVPWLIGSKRMSPCGLLGQTSSLNIVRTYCFIRKHALQKTPFTLPQWEKEKGNHEPQKGYSILGKGTPGNKVCWFMAKPRGGYQEGGHQPKYYMEAFVDICSGKPVTQLTSQSTNLESHRGGYGGMMFESGLVSGRSCQMHPPLATLFR